MGATSTGGVEWQIISGTWGITTNRPTTATAQTSNPLVALEAGYSDVDISLAISASGGDCIYFRVVDASNWLRLRFRYRYYQTSSDSTSPSTTEYRWNAQFYGAHAGTADLASCQGGAVNHQASMTAVSAWSTTLGSCPHASSQTHSHTVYDHGNNCQAFSNFAHPHGRTSCTSESKTTPGTTTTTYYDNYDHYLYLDKCVAGTVTTIGSQSLGTGTATSLRVLALGTNIQCFRNGLTTAGITVTDSTHLNATKHGFGKGVSVQYGTAIDNFSIKEGGS
jgi:hypothetical protein